jgi:hypothetical protein
MENGQNTKKFLPAEFEKEGPAKILQGDLRRLRQGGSLGSSSSRKEPPLPRLFQ